MRFRGGEFPYGVIAKTGISTSHLTAGRTRALPSPGDAMVMTGEETKAGERAKRVRATITPDGAGRVRQTWERLKDNGTGKEELVLLYVR